MKKRFLSFFVAIMMLIATLPLSSITASAAKVQNTTLHGALKVL